MGGKPLENEPATRRPRSLAGRQSEEAEKAVPGRMANWVLRETFGATDGAPALRGPQEGHEDCGCPLPPPPAGSGCTCSRTRGPCDLRLWWGPY